MSDKPLRLNHEYFTRHIDKLGDLRDYLRTVLNPRYNQDLDLMFNRSEGWRYLRYRALNMHDQGPVDDESLGRFIRRFKKPSTFLATPVFVVTPSMCAITYAYLLNERFNFAVMTADKSCEILGKLLGVYVSREDPAVPILQQWCTHPPEQIRAAMIMFKDELGEREAVLNKYLKYVARVMHEYIKKELYKLYGKKKRSNL